MWHILQENNLKKSPVITVWKIKRHVWKLHFKGVWDTCKSNHKEVSAHTTQNKHEQKNYKRSMLKRFWRNAYPQFEVGRNLVRATNGNRMEGPLKGKPWATIWSTRPTSRGWAWWINPKKTELERHRQANLHCRSITIAKTWKQPKRPSRDEWTKKKWYMYRWNISQGKKWNDAICRTIEESRGNHATGSKWESERHISCHITYGCYLKIDTNEDISREKGNHRFIKPTYVSPNGKVWGLDTLRYWG